MSAPTPTPQVPEIEQPASAQRLLVVLDDITKNARHAADPRQPAEQLAQAFADYLRSPD